ncbi:amidohydrolase family protein [Thermoproteota archaeon]
MDILIKNGFIATMDKDQKIYPKGSIHIIDDKIASIGNSDEIKPLKPEVVIDAKNKSILPGFVNTHTHLPSTAWLKGLYDHFPLATRHPDSLVEIMFGIHGYIPKKTRLFALVSCAEAIYGGSTTIVDTKGSASDTSNKEIDEFNEVVKEVGLRALLGSTISEIDFEKLRKGRYEYIPGKGEKRLKDALDVYNRWHGKGEGRIKVILAPHAPDLTLPETYLSIKEAAEKYRLRMTTHLSQSWSEVVQVKKRFGKTPPQHLYDIGVMNDKLSSAHCIFCTNTDTMLIKKTGMTILHNPRAYLLGGGVTAPLNKWLEYGIPIGLGTDDAFHSMCEVMKSAIYAARVRSKYEGGYYEMVVPEPPNYYKILELATIEGAKSLGLDKEIGSLEVGKKADINIFNMKNPHLTPAIEPITSIVLYASSADIETVIIDGKIIKDKGLLVNNNMNNAIFDAEELVKDIWVRWLKDNPEIEKIWKKNRVY